MTRAGRRDDRGAIGAAACASSACRTRPIRRSRATSPRFSRARRRCSEPAHAAVAEWRPADDPSRSRCCSTAGSSRRRSPATASCRRWRVVRRAAAGAGDRNLEAAVARRRRDLRPARVPAIGRAGALVKAGSGRAYYIGLRERGTRRSRPGGLRPRPRHGGRDGTDIEHPFTVVTNRPSRSRSTARRSDPIAPATSSSLAPGDDAHEHAPLVTVLRYGRKSRQVELPVRLSVAFTEVGTLELWCESQASEHRWRLQFQVRSEETGRMSAEEAAARRTESERRR